MKKLSARDGVFFGGSKNQGYIHKPAVNTAEGILIGWNKDSVEVLDYRAYEEKVEKGRRKEQGSLDKKQ